MGLTVWEYMRVMGTAKRRNPFAPLGALAQ